ncbi:hypothetical protein [Variovorax sp. OV329]|uniref:hypothetical protein n=1 Tax=Variovorax sp. OV329 TaxID=1882825 RepID=UPI0020C90223|nr:hypothetical protein [Variovorax sp. OV329]
MKVVLAEPAKTFSASELAKRTRLEAQDVERTQEHLLKSGILARHKPTGDDQAGTVGANTAFIFYAELRAIALKSFAAAEPIRAMLRSKFKDSVLRAFLLGEDEEATIELLVVHGQQVPDEAQMSTACRKLSATIGRHLKVHVISSRKHEALTARDDLGARLAAGPAIEIIALGDTKAQPAVERGGLLQSARQKLAALAR